MLFCIHGNHITFNMWQISELHEHSLHLRTGSKASFRQHARPNVMSNAIQTIDNVQIADYLLCEMQKQA